MEAIEYVNNGNHLPDFLKDFHDQKEVFKAVCQQTTPDGGAPPPVNWIDAHVFTIDFFLHWIALHGYKLQKIRASNVDFYEIEETLSALRKKSSDDFFESLKERLK